MNRDREQMWQAYVDGELSACEAAQFEASLTDADRTRLAADMRFERALSERMREDVKCPLTTWQRAQSMAMASERVVGNAPVRRVALAGMTLAAAAVLAFVLSGGLGLFDAVDDSHVIHAAASVAELRAESQTEPGWEQAQAFLNAKGVLLNIEDRERILDLVRPHAPIEILGARQESVGGSEVTEILVACCDKPVRIVLAPKDSDAARLIGRAAGDESADVQATRKVKDYMAAVVSKHRVHGLTNLVDADWH